MTRRNIENSIEHDEALQILFSEPNFVRHLTAIQEDMHKSNQYNLQRKLVKNSKKKQGVVSQLQKNLACCGQEKISP